MYKRKISGEIIVVYNFNAASTKPLCFMPKAGLSFICRSWAGEVFIMQLIKDDSISKNSTVAS